MVPLPAGADPAELIQRDGAQAITAAVERSVAFVRFRVERVLAAGDDSTPEGRDRMIEELRPVFATLAPSAMRMELTRIVSGRLALPESLAEQLLAAGAAPRAAARGRAAPQPSVRCERRTDRARARRACRGVRTPSARFWRCASPRRRRASLRSKGLDVDEQFSSELLRRAARHLREGDLSEPMADASRRGGQPGRRP